MQQQQIEELKTAKQIQQQEETRGAIQIQQEETRAVTHIQQVQTVDSYNLNVPASQIESSGNANLPTIVIGNELSGNADDNQGERPFNRAGSAISLSHVKEAAIEHLKNIGQTYNLSDDCLRMLIITKLKGNAQRWLHANPT